MKPNPKLIFEQPNIENTIPLSVYQASSPEKFSIEDDDKLVMHAGGSGYEVSVLRNDPTQVVKVHEDLESMENSSISLFVLNTCLIIWLDEIQKGLELPYQSISLSALQSNNDHQALYLQVLSNDYISSIPTEPTEYTSTVELIITKKKDIPENMLNRLFESMVSDIHGLYNGLSTCSAFHYDSDSDEENGANSNGFYGLGFQDSDTNAPALEIPSSWIDDEGHDHDITIKNIGDADDLELDEEELQRARDESGTPVAGMNVDVGYASIVGSIRKRGEDDMGEFNKSRKLI